MKVGQCTYRFTVAELPEKAGIDPFLLLIARRVNRARSKKPNSRTVQVWVRRAGGVGQPQRGYGPMAEWGHNPVGVENRTDANPE